MDDAPLHEDVGAPPGGRAFRVHRPEGARVRYAVWQGSGRGSILLFPGRTEYIEKYGDVVRHLQGHGFDVLVIDWRGQGLSSRPKDEPNLGHIADFSTYQDDLAAILDHAEASLRGPRWLIAHSMGGCIGLRALQNGLKVEGAVFSGPMWGLRLGGLPLWLAKLIGRVATGFGLGLSWPPGMGPASYVLSNPFEGNLLTGDAANYASLQKALLRRPELGLGSPSYGWMNAALDEMGAIMDAPAPELPILTCLGTDERIVSGDAIRNWHARHPAARLVMIEGGQHEVFVETEERRRHAWQEIDYFLGV